MNRLAGGIGVVVLAMLGLPMLVVPDVLLGIFIDDPQTIEVGRLPLQVATVISGAGRQIRSRPRWKSCSARRITVLTSSRAFKKASSNG